MRGLTLRELKNIKALIGQGKGCNIPFPLTLFIWNFANIYTSFTEFKDALNYVIAVISNDKTHMPTVGW